MDSSVVIKVKYEETLRRFNVPFVDAKLDNLREKIVGLLKFSPDTEFTMSYVDEDNDVVTLADDGDLRDVARRGLNPLRITVNLTTVRSDKSSSTPLRSPQVQQPLENFNSEILNSIAEPNVPKTTIDPFPLPFSPGICSNLNSQPIPTPSSEGIRNMFGSIPGNSSTSNPVPCPMSEYPFTGMPLGNSSAIPERTHPFVVQTRRNQRQEEQGPVMIFHRGVHCVGCGVHPIAGIRFKSKVKEDYDLCTYCFGQMGNEEDYIRMDRPILTYRHSFSFKGLHELPTRGNPAQPSRSKLDSRFIQDMNVSYGILMAPFTPFTKIFRMKNNGAVVWPQGTLLVWIGGDILTDAFSVELEIPDAGLPVDKELDIAVDFVAPKDPGQYISYWRMASPSGQRFGQSVWVLIQVDAKELAPESFNLNLPPASNGISYPEIINVNPEPTVELGLPDSVGPNFDLGVHKEQDANFPINDSLLVGGAVSRTEPSALPALSVSYPIVDLSEVAPPMPVQDPVAAPVSVVETPPAERNKKLAVPVSVVKTPPAVSVVKTPPEERKKKLAVPVSVVFVLCKANM